MPCRATNATATTAGVRVALSRQEEIGLNRVFFTGTMRRKRKLRGTEVWGWGRGVGVEWSTFCSRGGPSECNVFEPHPRCRHVVAGPAACDANATTHPSAPLPLRRLRAAARVPPAFLPLPHPHHALQAQARRPLFFIFHLLSFRFTIHHADADAVAGLVMGFFSIPVASESLFIWIFTQRPRRYLHIRSQPQPVLPLY